MPAPLADEIISRVVEARELYHRLVLVVGPMRSGKTQALRAVAKDRGWPLINVNLQISERMLELTQRQRALRAPRLLDDVVSDANDDVVLLDNLEMLFSPDLALDTLRLLQGLSRNRTVVATWCGGYDGTYLTYAEPGHPEWKRDPYPERGIVAASESPSSHDHQDPTSANAAGEQQA
jgi:hypothetical protein